MNTKTPTTIYLKDYKTPDFLIPEIHLYVNLNEETTLVTATSTIIRQPTASVGTPLILDGESTDENMKLISVKINGAPVPVTQYQLTSENLTLPTPDAVEFELEITTELRPQNNQAFVGLYKTKKIFCTQMEAQGFRRMTYFLDRPDVLAKYTTTIEAEQKKYPYLLSNGDRVKTETLANGRHRMTWKDPFPKPCYLFALVAGDLGLVKDQFTTKSGRDVALEIYTDKGNESRCGHAMQSLKQSMQWDEDVYDLEYDLNVYMIVAVDDFNMGAMENKGLNIFNSRFVLSDEQTATDQEALAIQTVIAHEYFHNWSGNRVTCRDWFQLSLKEGLTVFRDQEFSSDMNSRGVKRVEDVINVRTRQFPEDASGMAHPIRPSSYMAIDNFYTRTVYDKGAEVIRMLQTLLGRDLFIQGCKKYFALFDGQAVTTDDFIRAHEMTSDRDLTQFKNWYNQAGTPQLNVVQSYDSVRQELHLRAEQKTVDPVTQKLNQPYVIPLQYAAFTSSGTPMALQLSSGEETTSGVLHIHQESQEFVFTHVKERPVLSLLREFSAPVKMNFEQGREDLLLLMAKDNDPFCRYEAAQKLFMESFRELLTQIREQHAPKVDEDLLSAIKTSLANLKNEDPAFLAKLLSPPSVSYFMQFCPDENVELVEKTFRAFFDTVSENLRSEFQQSWNETRQLKKQNTSRTANYRALEGILLFYTSWKNSPETLAALKTEYTQATTMTDVMNVLMVASHKNDTALFTDFAQKWRDNSLVMNKWFTAQAVSWRSDALERVQELLTHPSYDKTNPNKIFSLVYSFTSLNPLRFHRYDGRGYSFAADQILDVDSRNPQVAARLTTCFNEWMKWDAPLKALARTQIERIHQTSGLSKNVYEIVNRALQMS